MPALNLLGLLTNWRVLAALGFAGVLGFAGLQSVRLSHAKADLAKVSGQLTDTRKALAANVSALKLSEDKRAVEYSLAVRDASEADRACSVRVAGAHRSAARIKAIVEKPVALDSNHCPVRSVIGAGELRDAIRPGP